MSNENRQTKSRVQQEKEIMEKHGGVIFVVSKKEYFLKTIGNPNSALIYDDRPTPDHTSQVSSV